MGIFTLGTKDTEPSAWTQLPHGHLSVRYPINSVCLYLSYIFTGKLGNNVEEVRMKCLEIARLQTNPPLEIPVYGPDMGFCVVNCGYRALVKR